MKKRIWYQSGEALPDPDYQLVLDRAAVEEFEVPTAAQRAIDSQAIVDLKAIEAWDLLDLWGALASSSNKDFARINWKDPTGDLFEEVDSPTWEASKGFGSNGTSSYINFKWIPSAAANYLQNDCCIGGVLTVGEDSATAKTLLGCSDATHHILLFDSATGGVSARINSGQTNTVFTGQDNFRNSMYSGVRTGSTALSTHVDGPSVNTGTTASSGRPTTELYGLARNLNGTADLFAPSTWRLGVVFAGSGAIDQEALYTVINTWLAASNSDTLQVDNSGNIDALADQVELNLDSTNFDFQQADTTGSNIKFLVNESIINHFVEYWDHVNRKARVWVEVNGAAGATINVTFQYGRITGASSNFAMMQRMESDVAMSNLYLFDADGNDDVGAVNFTLNNSAIDNSGKGNALSLNGSTGFATAELLNILPINMAMMFSFIPKTTHKSGSVRKVIWSKYNDANNYWILELSTEGTVRMTINDDSSIITFNSTRTTWHEGEIITFSFRKTESFLVAHLQNDFFFSTGKANWPTDGTQGDFTFGCLNDGTTQSAFADVYILDFAMFDDFYTHRKERAWAKKRNVFNYQEADKWQTISQYPATFANGQVYGEPSLLYDSGNLILYVKHRPSTTDSRLERVVSSDGGLTWGSPTDVLGHGVGGENDQIHRPYVFFDDNTAKYYCIYTTVPAAGGSIDGNLYIVESIDGITFSNKLTLLTKFDDGGTPRNLHNSCVLWDGTKYVGICDVENITGQPQFTACYFEGVDLASMAFTGINPHNNLQFNAISGAIYGGCFFKKVGSTWHIWRQSNLRTGSTPNHIFRASASSISDNSWSDAYEGGVLIFDSDHEVDQRADFHLAEGINEVFSVATRHNNSPLESAIEVNKYTGTLAQLVADVTAEIT